MTKAPVKSYTHDHVVLDDGMVTFKCSSNLDLWPWLALPPLDPIVVQTINYWASVETGAARGTLDTRKWSALTQTEWTCGQPDVGHATHGLGDTIGDADSPRYRLTFFDNDGALVYSMSGKGVVFQNRDFESWRKKAKQKVVAPLPVTDFPYASSDQVGVAAQDQCFLSPLEDSETPSARVLITKEKGFHPRHPYHSGSGDHVNSNQLADVARQFATLILGDPHHLIINGTMRFDRYVELGRPFRITLDADGGSSNVLSMTVDQADRSCASIELGYIRS